MYCNVTLRRFGVIIVGVEQQLNITHREYVPIAVVVQYANRVRHIILSSAACLALPYFSTLPHNGAIFEGKKRC